MKEVTIQNVTKRFGEVTAVDDVSLKIEAHSFTTLLGPSGCGKTTLLRMLAGLEEPTAGTITVGDRTVFSDKREINVPPKDRGIGLVFQSYALWPHMTVFDNVAYGLRIQRLSRPQIRQEVEQILNTVEMGGYEDRFPSELSGGQQQRISLARMLAMKPEILLMDEPLSNLDAKLRFVMRTELKRIHRDTGITIVYVTHDQSEAMTLSTHVAVMKDGVVEQYDTPQNVYRHSSTLFVADFMGNPANNELDGRIQRTDGKPAVRLAGGTVIGLTPGSLPDIADGTDVVVSIRPELVRVSKEPLEDGLQARVYAALDTGPDLYVNVDVDGVNVFARGDRAERYGMDETVHVSFPAEHCLVYDRGSGRLLSETV